MARMDDDMPWFRELSAQDRSWVGVIVQAGIKSFVDWYADEVRHPELDGSAVAAQVFGAAPRALAGVISLQQTVDLVRLGIEVVESNLDAVLDPDDARDVHAGVLRYGREVAFATAEVYARAAEVRGAWDARLEALVVDSVLRAEADETMLSRASALGWGDSGSVAVVLGSVHEERRETDLFDDVRRAARAAGMDALCATQGDRLVVLLGGVGDDVGDTSKAARAVLDFFGPGPVVVGPAVDDLEHAHVSARGALSAHRAAAGLAGRTTAGALRRDAPRARPGRRRPRPPPPGRGGLPAAPRRPRAPSSRPWRRTTPRAGRSRPPPGRCSATPTPCATGCARSAT